MSALGKLVVSLSLESAQFTKGLDKSTQETQRFSKNTQGSLVDLDKVAGQAFSSMAKAVLLPVASFVSVSTALSLLKNSLDFADKINDISLANEVAVGTVLNLSQALSLNGGEADNASKLFSSLTAKLGEAADGSESAQAQFKKVGISLKDLATLDGQALFEKTLSGLMAIEDPVTRNAAAMDLLGKAVKGVDIAGLGSDFSDNKQNFVDADEKFKAIGAAMDKIDEASTKLKTSIAVSIEPWYVASINYIDKLITGYDTLEQNIRKANKAQGGGDGKWTAAPKITDKPAFGSFNLPAEYQGGSVRNVTDTAAERANTKAATAADAAAKKAQADALDKLNEKRKYQLDLIKEEIDEELVAAEALGKVYSDKIKAQQDYTDALSASFNATLDLVNAEQDNVANLQRQIDVFNSSEVAVQQLEAAKLLDAAATYEQSIALMQQAGASEETINWTYAQIDALKQLGQAKKNSSDKTKELEDLQNAKKINDEFWKSIEGTAHTVWTNLGQEGTNVFKSIGKTIKSTILDMLYQITVKKWIIGISASVSGGAVSQAVASTGALGTAGGGSSGGIGNILSSGRNIFDSFTSGIGNFQTNFASSIATFGNFISDLGGGAASGGLLNSLGSSIAAGSEFLSNAIPYAGALIKLAQGDAKGAVFTAAGAAIGSIIPGIGTAIGAVIGSFIGSFVGGKDKGHRSGAGVGTNYNNGIFTTGYVGKGTATKFDSSYVDPLTNLSKQFATELGSLLTFFGQNANISLGADFKAKQKGGDGNTKGEFGGSVNGKSFVDYFDYNQKDTQAFQSYVNSVLGTTLVKAIQSSSLSDGVKKFFDGLSAKEDVLNTINTLTTLTTALNDLPTVFKAIKSAIDNTEIQLNATQLQQSFNNISTYTSLFYSQSENFATYTKQLTTTFKGMNLILPGTRDGFRNIVDGIDTTTTSGLGLFNQLVSLAPTLDAYYKALQSQADGINQVNAALAEGLDKNLFSTYADYITAQANVMAGKSPLPYVGDMGTRSNGGNSDLLAEVKSLRAEQASNGTTMKAVLEAIATYTYNSAKTLKQFNNDGLPAERTA